MLYFSKKHSIACTEIFPEKQKSVTPFGLQAKSMEYLPAVVEGESELLIEA